MTASDDVGGNDDVDFNGNGNGDNDDDSEWSRWLAMQLYSPSSRLVSNCLSALLFFLR